MDLKEKLEELSLEYEQFDSIPLTETIYDSPVSTVDKNYVSKRKVSHKEEEEGFMLRICCLTFLIESCYHISTCCYCHRNDSILLLDAVSRN